MELPFPFRTVVLNKIPVSQHMMLRFPVKQYERQNDLNFLVLPHNSIDNRSHLRLRVGLKRKLSILASDLLRLFLSKVSLSGQAKL